MAVKDEAAPDKKNKKWDPKPSHKIIYTILTVLITLAVVAGGAGAYWYFKQDTKTTINNDAAPSIVKTVVAPDAARAHFDETTFSMDLPADWKRLPPDLSGTYNQYKYQATKKNADNRYLSVYVDRIPLTLSVSKEVAVQSNGQTLSHGNVSDNCRNFTTRATSQTHLTTARWDGVSFICDMDTIAGTTVGTSSPNAINSVTLTNVGFTDHKFFFVYEDDNYTPDYGIMYNMLDSFKVK
jgi:hypothetical protein